MHLGHVVPPGDEDIGVVDIFVAAHGFIQAEGGHETRHGAGHAESGIGLDIVGADASLEQLGGHVPVRDGPLTRSNDGKARYSRGRPDSRHAF